MKIKLSAERCILALLGSIILSFGIYNVHSLSGVTEGGALGLTLLFEYWFHISPAVTSAVINIVCYAVGIKTFGKDFIFYSIISTFGLSGSYAVFERFPRVFPEIADLPLLAAIVGAVFVGVGVGLAVRAGGAPTGDDALAMSLSKIFKLNIEWIYLITDITVLALSLTYIPPLKIFYSVITVVISGQIVGLIQRIKFKKDGD
ncbi:MAG: YitT family protein [Clostridia bacterium]|nr:YitT family protein [Clostridia bacterium]